MNVAVLRRAMIGLTVLGIALAAYLTYVHYSGTKPACTAGQSCIKVQTSQWSRLDGVPVALIGLIGYVFILGSLLVRDREESRLATLGLTFIGFGFSAYLTYRELFSIHAVCEECATSAVFLTILLISAIALYLSAPPAPRSSRGATEPPAKAAASATLSADGQ
ncbi:MAG TPA: vitamin K epoxide reductase family protein [Solirubrobacteraceae bacterium]|nr:vitamin K epoxide reductase family protein [Solirubrobacteraceae bacterium]